MFTTIFFSIIVVALWMLVGDFFGDPMFVRNSVIWSLMLTPLGPSLCGYCLRYPFSSKNNQLSSSLTGSPVVEVEETGISRKNSVGKNKQSISFSFPYPILDMTWSTTSSSDLVILVFAIVFNLLRGMSHTVLLSTKTLTFV